MEVPLEHDELRMLSEKREHRVHTGGFRTDEHAESVSGLLESEMSVPFDHTNDGMTKEATKVVAGNIFQNNLGRQKKLSEAHVGDPLKGLKKGLLMSTVAPTAAAHPIGNLNPISSSKLYYSGGKNISLGSTDLPSAQPGGLTRNMNEVSPLSSISASYQNVDFLAVPETYKVVKSISKLHNNSSTNYRSSSLVDNKNKTQKMLQSGIVISHGKQFLNEPKKRFMHRMQSQPSKAHADAMKMVEELNTAMMDD